MNAVFTGTAGTVKERTISQLYSAGAIPARTDIPSLGRRRGTYLLYSFTPNDLYRDISPYQPYQKDILISLANKLVWYGRHKTPYQGRTKGQFRPYQADHERGCAKIRVPEWITSNVLGCWYGQPCSLVRGWYGQQTRPYQNNELIKFIKWICWYGWYGQKHPERVIEQDVHRGLIREVVA